MSLVKKNRINHFKGNKQNKKKRAQELAEQSRRLNADMKALLSKKA